MKTEYSLEEIERLDRIWTDQFAAQRGWEAFLLEDPIDDLELFFSALSGSDMLDVGCGWGRYIFRFLNQGLTYQGIDHSMEMLKAARTSNPGTNFTHGSFRALPFSDNYFNGLWSCCALAAFPKAHLIKILKEHRRVLKLGGVMMIVMPAPPSNVETMYLDSEGNPTIYQAYYYLDEFEGYVETAGFEILQSDIRYAEGSFFVLMKNPR